MAAVLAAGDQAVLSHGSAAQLWGMLKPSSGVVHVTVPVTSGRDSRRRGIHVHRSRSLPQSETTRVDGIPVTRPARTIRDLRRGADPDLVRLALREAEFLQLDVRDARGSEPILTRSALERRFHDACVRAGLPEPAVNAKVGPYEVDFLWARQRVIVEVDGFQAHSGGEAFEMDRRRDADLHALGYTVLRFSYRQVHGEWPWVEAKLRAVLR
jgi:very-short-patch-repair endonuclease